MRACFIKFIEGNVLAGDFPYEEEVILEILPEKYNLIELNEKIAEMKEKVKTLAEDEEFIESIETDKDGEYIESNWNTRVLSALEKVLEEKEYSVFFKPCDIAVYTSEHIS